MIQPNLDLKKDFNLIRREFPILEKCVYLISNSLGAVPRRAKKYLERYYRLWAEEGVKAWEEEWWYLAQRVATAISFLIGAGSDEVTMVPNATIGHWLVLSTLFSNKDKKRKKIVVTDQDFPSILYAVAAISEFTKWEIVMIKSSGQMGIEVDKILEQIDEETLAVVTSHVYFKSAYIQNIPLISARAREVGTLTVIDGYHAPGVIPVNVKNLDVDFYISGCLKWLCGGPGNGFLYARSELSPILKPLLTGWFAHKMPFSFNLRMDYTRSPYRFMSGTPPIPCFYAALAGLDIINRIGMAQIRQKSLVLTQLIIDKAKERDFGLFTPQEEELRGGAVSVNLPYGFAVKQALSRKKIKVDFRKGKGQEPDVIRIAPHFYNREQEIEALFSSLDSIYSSGEYKQYSNKVDHIS